MTRARIDKSVGRRFFGQAPETYEAARPGHADEVYETLQERCGVRAGSRVVEVGPGTGQATSRLLALGADPLVAIEPDPALADYLRATFGEQVEVRQTAVEDTTLEPSAYDLAAAASSFHWVEEADALAKLFGALHPFGWIALWWTTFGDDTRPDLFREAVDPLFEDIPHGPSAPVAKGGLSFGLNAESRLEALRRTGFEELEGRHFRWTWEWDAAGIRALYSTFSPISALEPERRTEFLDAVERIAVHDFGGRVSRPLVTSLYIGRKPS